MSIISIVIGYFLLQAGARSYFASGGNQSLGFGLITLIMQVGGIGLIIYGLIILFN